MSDDKIEIQTGANSFAALDIEQDGRDVLIGFGAGQVRVVTDSIGAFDEDDFIFWVDAVQQCELLPESEMHPTVPLPPPPLALCLPATPRAVGQLPPALTPDLPAAAVWDDTDPAAGAGRGGAVARVAEHGCDVARAAVRRGGV